MKALPREKRCREEKLLYERYNLWEKVDNRRLRNCVNLLTCRQMSYERTNACVMGLSRKCMVKCSEDG